MRRIRQLIAAALVLALMLGVGALADVKTTGNVYLRTGPGLNYSKITAVRPGTTLKYLGETSIDNRGVAWYKVDHNGECWVSSRYSTLREEPTPVPTATPRPQPQPTQAGPGTTWSLIPNPTAQGPVDVAPYYLKDLSESAGALGLTNYREVISEAPNEYYCDDLSIGGNSLVEQIVLRGSGYSLFGATVGMNLEQVSELFSAAGLVRNPSNNPWSANFEHPADEHSLINSYGFDSCINLWLTDGVVTEMNWSSYT